MKQKAEVDEDDYESPEEDAPQVKIEELLADLKIHDGQQEADAEEDGEDWEDDGVEIEEKKE